MLSGFQVDIWRRALEKDCNYASRMEAADKEEVTEQLLAWATELERRSAMPPQLTWEVEQSPRRRGVGARNYGSVINVLNAENVCNRPGSGSALNACNDAG
jgi:hypothetical protein